MYKFHNIPYPKLPKKPDWPTQHFMLTIAPKQSYQSEKLYYYACIFILIMLRKNSEKRFHTAGARIVNSTKLPPDFFRPTKSLEKGRYFHRNASQPHQPLPPHTKFCSTVNPLLLTFNRSASLNKLDRPLRYSCTEGERLDWGNAASKGSTKLPRLSMEK